MTSTARKSCPTRANGPRVMWAKRSDPEQRRAHLLNARVANVVTGVELHSSEFSEEQR